MTRRNAALARKPVPRAVGQLCDLHRSERRLGEIGQVWRVDQQLA
jgi:hypothetical protein